MYVSAKYTEKFKLNTSLCCDSMFDWFNSQFLVLAKCRAYALLRFKEKNRLVRIQKNIVVLLYVT